MVAELALVTLTELVVVVTVPPSASTRARTWNFNAPLIPDSGRIDAAHHQRVAGFGADGGACGGV